MMKSIKKNWPLLVGAAVAGGLSSPVFADVDYQCLRDCTVRYSRAYCLQACEIRSPIPQQRYSSPVEAMIRGQQAAQEARAREAELTRLKAETDRVEAETQRIREQIARETAEAEEKARLQAENENLKQRLKALKEQQQSESQMTDCTAVPGPNGELVFPCDHVMPRTQKSLQNE